MAESIDLYIQVLTYPIPCHLSSSQQDDSSLPLDRVELHSWAAVLGIEDTSLPPQAVGL